MMPPDDPVCIVAPAPGCAYEIALVSMMPAGHYLPTIGIGAHGPYVVLLGNDAPTSEPWPWPVIW